MRPCFHPLDDPCAKLLAVTLVGNAEDLYVRYIRMAAYDCSGMLRKGSRYNVLECSGETRGTY